MISFGVMLTLIEDTAISGTAASTGNHQTLPYIPGVKLLGAAARAYDSFGDDAWDVFHSGKVRFGNAYPCHDGSRSMPVMRSWTDPKSDNEPPLLEKSARDRFFHGGLVIKMQTVRRPKTAIDRHRRGVVADGQFFDISALQRGQIFKAQIYLDDSLAHQEARLRALFDGADLTLGRSRTAEFGRVSCKVVDKDPPPACSLVAGAMSFQVYCVSDLDFEWRRFEGSSNPPETAQTLVTNENEGDQRNEWDNLRERMGLPETWSAKADNGLRYRSYTGFNSFRGLPTTERKVIERGATFTLCGSTPLTDHELGTILEAAAMGIGRGCAEGLGEILVSPDFLDTPPLEARANCDVKSSSGTVPRDALFAWALQRASRSDREAERRQAVRAALAQLEALYEQALEEAVAARKPLKDVAPSRAQWGEMRNIAKAGQSREDFRRALFDAKRGLTQGSQTGRTWKFVGQIGETQLSFADLMQAFVDQADEAAIATHLTALATEAPRLLAKLEGRN